MACSKEDNSTNDNLETFSIWWLDAEVSNEENRNVQQQLRCIINDLKTWQCQEEFEESIRRMSQDDRVILIVSGRIGREVVPRIHQLRQVSLIYVYCWDKKANEQWARDYKKVKGVFIQLDELVSQIKLSHRYFMKSEEPLLISIFETDKTMTELNGQFLNFQLLIEILLRMKSNETDRKEFISMCKNKYKDNTNYLKVAEEFDTKYKSEEAIQWYTQQSFIYEILNTSLRKENIDILVLLRSFINDIRRQLRRNQCDQSIRVYRGQQMSRNELSSYQNSIGQLISINSFFSTSLNKETAITFATYNDSKYSTNTSNNDDLERVLFEIDADSKVVTNTNRPFANISSLSCFSTEAEVLFMVGSMFRLDKINLHSFQHGEYMLTIIRMTLCGNDQHDVHELYDSMINDYGHGRTDLRSLGTLLVKMGKFDLAEKYYHKMLDQLSSKDNTLADLYHSLGHVADEKGENDKSLEWYHKALALKKETRPSNHVSICDSYNGIGIVLHKKGNGKQALEYYNKAVSLFQQAHDEDHLKMGSLYHNIGFIYSGQHNYTNALFFYKKSIEVKQKHLISNHPDLAITYNTMGHAYNCLGDYNSALEYHNRSLEINRKALPSFHPNIAMNHRNIGLAYSSKHEFELALENLKYAKKIYRHSLSSQSPDVIKVERAIQYVANKIKQI